MHCRDDSVDCDVVEADRISSTASEGRSLAKLFIELCFLDVSMCELAMRKKKPYLPLSLFGLSLRISVVLVVKRSLTLPV